MNGEIIYVRPERHGDGSGKDWANAKGVNDALESVEPGQSLVLGGGEMRPGLPDELEIARAQRDGITRVLMEVLGQARNLVTWTTMTLEAMPEIPEGERAIAQALIERLTAMIKYLDP